MTPSELWNLLTATQAAAGAVVDNLQTAESLHASLTPRQVLALQRVSAALDDANADLLGAFTQ